MKKLIIELEVDLSKEMGENVRIRDFVGQIVLKERPTNVVRHLKFKGKMIGLEERDASKSVYKN